MLIATNRPKANLEETARMLSELINKPGQTGCMVDPAS